MTTQSGPNVASTVHLGSAPPAQSQAIAPLQSGALVPQPAATQAQPLSTTTAYPRLQAIAVIIAAILGPTATIVVAGMAQNEKPAAEVVVNCAETWGQAIELHKANPQIDFPYDGPAEDQCHVSRVIEQLKNQPVVPLPGPTS